MKTQDIKYSPMHRKNIKYTIISLDTLAAKKVSETTQEISKALSGIYHPKQPYSVRVNLSQKLDNIKDERIKSIAAEVIIGIYKELEWEVVSTIEEDDEIIYIQNYKGGH